MTAAETFSPTEGCDALSDQLQRLVVVVEALHTAVGDLPRQATPQGKRVVARISHLSRIADEVAGESVELIDDVDAKLAAYQERQRAAKVPR